MGGSISRLRASVRPARGWTTGQRDAAIALAAAALLAVERAAAAAAPDVQELLAILGIAGGLALRRRAPLPGYLVGCTGLMMDAATPGPLWTAPYANLFALYGLALYATRRHAWMGVAVMPLFVLGYYAAAGGKVGVEADPPAVMTTVLGWLAVWTIGYNAARRREEQQVARHLLQQQAVADERTRIARELHDLVGHTINVMLLQAGASRRVVDRDPARACGLLLELERGGREALSELDRVLGVLRGADHAAVAEASGVAVLPDLARRMTSAGLRVDLEIAADVEPLPGSLDLTVHRIVQEALTNALKHGQARAASVVVRRVESALDVEVHDDGRGASTGYAPGRGLLGIRERAAMFGGSLEHGPSGRDGFRVHVRLPVPTSSGLAS
jgi:signal transduction histidine kinase